MAYKNNIPLANDYLSISQGDLLNNFIALQSYLYINHGTFGSGNEGKHNTVVMPDQGITAPASAVAGNMTLFSKLNAISGVQEIYVQRGVDNANAVPMTIGHSAGNAQQNWAMTPSGQLIKFGFSATTNPAGLKTVALNSSGPLFSHNPFIQLTIIQPFAGPGNYGSIGLIDGWTALQFVAQTRDAANAPAVFNFQWYAIGQAA